MRHRWSGGLVLLLFLAGLLAGDVPARFRLLRALDAHRLPEVQALLRERPHLGDAWAPLLPPEPFLERAIESGDPDAVSAFLDAGADPTRRSERGLTSLHLLALREGVHDAFHRAAALGHPLDLADVRGRTPLGLAVSVENGGALAALLETGASVTAGDRRGWTPLHLAAILDRATMMHRLLQKAPDPNPADRWGWTPLDWAGSQGNHRVVGILRAAGARPGAAKRDPAGEIRQRVRAGAPVVGADAEAGFWGFPPLHWATLLGDDDLVAEVLARGGSVHEADSEAGWTPLHFAAWRGDADAARRLLAAGADPGPASEVGYTPLHLAVWRGRPDVLQVLLDAGADVDAQDHDGETPLHESVYEDRPELMRTLLARGARVDAADRDGRTPLHAAAEKGLFAQARLLLAAGADRHRRDADGRTPYDWSTARGDLRLMRLLAPPGER